ncbi:MAG: thioredoxin-dependent thiol peroxidase [Bacteroidia bacterium]|nr:thioredoxin-dependent thiol peroxidase [Bacteroidia bacterium]
MAFLEIGSLAPQDIVLQNQGGEEVSLGQLKGQKVIVYFYPKANTPSCTKEACSLRDGYDKLRDLGYAIVGVSPDKPRSLTNFINKQSLNFDLWSDPEHQLTEAFGAWGEKSMYGKTYMGLLRTTFLLDEEGKVTHVIEKVISKDHANQILRLLGVVA